MSRILIAGAVTALVLASICSVAAAQEPAEAGAVLWLVDQPVAEGEDPVLDGVQQALAADRSRHLVGRSQLYERVADRAELPSECATGVGECGTAEALAFQALDLGVLIRLGVDRGTDAIKVNYEMVDRRGEIVSSGRLEAADGRRAGLELVARLFDAVGVVTFESTPPDAEVIVDGGVIGRTPSTRQFGVGTHRYRMELEGHEPVEETVEVRAEEPHRVEAELEPRPGRLRIQGAPAEATVHVDDRQIGRAGEVLEVQPGRYAMEVRAPDYEPDRHSVEIEPGELLEVEARMSRRPSFLRDVEADAIADHRLQLEIGLEIGGQMARFPGARTDEENRQRLFGGWGTEPPEGDPSDDRRFVTPGGLRLGFNWEGDWLGVGLLSASLVRRSFRRPFRLVDPADGSTSAATMTGLTSLQLRPMQLRARFFYENLAPFAQTGFGVNWRSIRAETADGRSLSLGHVDAVGALEAGVRYHFDPRWSAGVSYRLQGSLAGGTGLEHVLGIQVGVGLRDLPFVDAQPPGEL